MKILLTEDNLKFGKGMKRNLERDGNIVDWVQDGVASENAALNFDYEVIIMDINLPRENGIDVIKHLRNKKCYTPILILSVNAETQDRVNGLASGADDYLPKPCEYEELKERLNALIRRENRLFSNLLEYKDLIINPRTHEVTFQGERLNLTPLQYALILTLMRNISKTIVRNSLLNKMYPIDNSLKIKSNTLEVHICSLRKLLGKGYIQSIRGVGYRIG